MHCQSCSMPMIEGFEEEQFKIQHSSKQNKMKPQFIKNELKKWKKEGFANDDGLYSCQSQSQQSCVYTAQGEIVCNKGK